MIRRILRILLTALIWAAALMWVLNMPVRPAY